jgi:hypothetical protein
MGTTVCENTPPGNSIGHWLLEFDSGIQGSEFRFSLVVTAAGALTHPGAPRCPRWNNNRLDSIQNDPIITGT